MAAASFSDDPSSVAGAGYVENYFVLGGSPSHVSRQLQAIANDLRRRGLAVHDVQEPSQDCDFLGLSLRKGRWPSLRTRNIRRLRAAIRGALRCRRISGLLQRVLAGYIMWALCSGGRCRARRGPPAPSFRPPGPQWRLCGPRRGGSS